MKIKIELNDKEANDVFLRALLLKIKLFLLDIECNNNISEEFVERLSNQIENNI